MPSTHDLLHAARQQELRELESLLSISDLCVRSSKLVHALQSERGMSNLLLGSGDMRFMRTFQDKAVVTDQRLGEFVLQLDTHMAVAPTQYRSSLLTRVALALDALDGLTALRYAVSDNQFDLGEITRRYTITIGALIAVIFEAIDVTVDQEVSRLLLAILNLIEGKEAAGFERATGSRILVASTSDSAELILLADLIEDQEAALARFESFCSEPIRAEWNALKATMPLAELERLRRRLITAQAESGAAAAESWFSVCTERLDGLHAVELHLWKALESACAIRIQSTHDLLEDYGDTLSINHGLPHGLNEVTDHSESNLQQHLGSRISRSLQDMLQEQSRKLQAMSSELTAVRATLDERKLIDRAKGLLMAQHGLSEEKAYNLLRQKAMRQNMRLSEIASSLLAVSDLITPADQ